MKNTILRILMVAAVIAFLATTLFFAVRGLLYLVLPIYNMAAIVVLGILVLLRSPWKPLNRSFFFIAVVIGIWSFSILRYWASGSAGEALIWALLANGIGGFMPAFFIQFTNVFPYEEKPANFLTKLIWFGPSFFFALAVYARLVVRDVVVTPQGYTVLPGPLFLYFVLYFFLYFGASFWRLLKNYRSYSGTVKMQIRYIFMGSFLGSVFALFTNLILPLFGNSSLTEFGPYFSLFFIAFTSYAIIRHRLMSIELVIQRSAVYAVATVMIMAFYALAVILSETVFRKMMGYSSVIITALAAIAIAIIYQPLVRTFQSMTDRIFFRGRYDYQKTLNKISQQIASVIRLEELTRLIASSFVDTMKVAEISFLLPDKERENFTSVPLSMSRYKRIEISVASPIIFWLLFYKDILVLDEIEDEIERLQPRRRQAEDRSRLLEQVRDEMERLGISLWVPIISKDDLIGVIALGDKLSGEVFTSEDFVLLKTLTNQTALALDNARLYSEVLSMKNYNEDVLQSMLNGVLTTDDQGKVITFNPMAEKISGRRHDDVIGRRCEEVWGKRGAITLAVEKTLNENPPANLEAGLASPERGLVPVSFSSTVLRDSQGRTGVLLSIQDLTDIKELEDKVRRTDKLAALATMAAGMAHEIKNPLSSMKVFTQLLPKKYDESEFRQKLEEVLNREINRIDRIVESLLSFTRATVPTFERGKVEEVLNEVLKNYEEQARASGIKIITSFTSLPEIELDRSQIGQAFSNFILNAIQAMPDGGEIKITTQPGKVVDDIIQTIKVSFSDTGHGISEEMQKKLFDPFFTTKYGGTGLGLTITHSIIDGHKGYIDLESQPGKGTTFIITLPVHQ